MKKFNLTKINLNFSFLKNIDLKFRISFKNFFKAKYIALFFIVYLIIFFYKAPASLVTSFISHPNLTFSRVSGSIYKGEIAKLKYDNFVLNDLSWDFIFKNLLLLKISTKINLLYQPFAPVSFYFGKNLFADYYIKNFILKSSFEEFIHAFRLQDYLLGDFNLQLNSFYFNKNYLCTKLDGNLSSKNLIFNHKAVNEPISFTDANIKATCIDKKINLELNGTSDFFSLTGGINISNFKDQTMTILLKPNKNMPQNMRSIIEVFLEKTPDGFVFEY